MADPALILALDGSTPTLSLALLRGEEVLAEEVREKENHSELLPSILDELLERGGLGRRDVDRIAVGIGPGSFTGLRVILAAAKGIAYAQGIPLVGVGSLEAMAHGAFRALPAASILVPVLDARKREVYVGLYRRTPEGVEPMEEGSDALVMPPAVLAERLAALEGPLALFGEGLRVYREVLEAATGGRRVEGGAALPAHPLARDVGRLGAQARGEASKAAIFTLEPRYVRSSDAELGWTRPAPR